MKTSLKKSQTPAPLILLVQNSALGRPPLSRALLQQGFRIAIARGVEEAREMLDDIRFIESEIDAIVVDYKLPDGWGSSIVNDISKHHPGVQTLMVTDEENIALELWSRAKGIRLWQYSQALGELQQWLEELKPAA